MRPFSTKFGFYKNVNSEAVLRLRSDLRVASESPQLGLYLKVKGGLDQGHGLRAVRGFVKKCCFLQNKWVIFQYMIPYFKGCGLDQDQP